MRVALLLLVASALRAEATRASQPAIARAEPEKSAAVTPMGKVIQLIESLKAQVEAEGEEEASVYQKFACFCKDTTMEKSKAITSGKDTIDMASADIAAKTAEKAETETELKERKAKQEELAAELKESQVRCAKEKAEYEANDADLTKAISGLNGAIGALTDAKPAALIELRDSVEQSLTLAGALGLIEKSKRLAVSAFLQERATVDPADPAYKYHSQGILDVISKLLAEYQSTKNDADTEWAKTKEACEETEKSLTAEMEANADAIKAAKGKIEELKGGIAEARKELVNTESLLKDDQAYLTDLTERCEARAKDWDQRSQLRAGELEALGEALSILQDRAAPMAEAANKRALIQSVSQPVLSFLQDELTRSRSLRQAQGLHRAVQGQAASLLRAEGQRLNSAMLSTLASHVAADPFAKIKVLIQNLIERLVREATEEATKKGFCDTELGKARKDRDFRLADVKKLNVEIAGLELKKDELEQEISELTESVEKLNEDLRTADEDRAEEKKTNMQTIKDAKAGLAAVNDAMQVLKAFYSKSARVRDPSLVQASPVDEDTDGAGFSGAYRGNQKQSTGIIGMLEVIQSDFKRTIKQTTAAEKASAAGFVDFDRTSKTDIGGKETKTELDSEDLETTKNAIKQGMDDLKTNMGLLDKALQTIEDLKPTCIDTTMSYEDRVAKREEEMEALKKALCILDTEGVEAECS